MAINDYEGAVILISHDRHIIETCVDTLWLVNDGTVKPFDGDMDDYTRLVLERAREQRRGERAAAQKRQPEKPPGAPRPSASTLQKTVDRLDRKMEEIRSKIDILDKALADPDLFAREPMKAADFIKLRAKLAGDLEEAENHWLEAQVG